MKHIQPYKELSLWTKALFLPTYLTITPYYFQEIPKITRNRIIDGFIEELKKSGIGALVEYTEDENGLMRIVATCYTDVTYEQYKSLFPDKTQEYSWMKGGGQDFFLRYINTGEGSDMRTHFMWQDGFFTKHS